MNEMKIEVSVEVALHPEKPYEKTELSMMLSNIFIATYHTATQANQQAKDEFNNHIRLFAEEMHPGFQSNPRKRAVNRTINDMSEAFQYVVLGRTSMSLYHFELGMRWLGATKISLSVE